MNRFYWVDNLKAVAIFLVVCGHIKGPSPLFKEALYAFHLPAFLFITGFLIAHNFKDISFSAFMKKYITPYVLIYGLFTIISGGIWYAIESYNAGFPVDAFDLISGGIYGVGGKERGLIHANPPLWYLPFLITTLIASYLSFKLPPLIQGVVIGIYFCLGLYYTGVRLPWCLELAGIGAVFILSGGILRQNINSFNNIAKHKYAIYMIPALSVLLIFLADLNGKVNINKTTFGQVEGLFLLNAFIGIFILILISYRLPANRLFNALSKHTLFIFCTHFYLVTALKKVPAPEMLALHLLMLAVLGGIITGICLLMSMKISPILDRYILKREVLKT